MIKIEEAKYLICPECNGKKTAYKISRQHWGEKRYIECSCCNGKGKLLVIPDGYKTEFEKDL